ncbi:hypothetical protein FAF44_21210 [Nonomuraea sp. MG754425]|uniref:hypothetical protein n=1 Tax=Nonomuraea sp. MG754425 TaxID=2570319 RepID=UPI001F3B47FC|nr:hypothetical protein [Nonomuraea sp. MG754425]MCF6470894.1 hypothetical protein [Nonomuraea sp. MG754425]
MSHKRSGLLPGLFMGLPAALVCAAGLGAAILFQQSLPGAVMSFGGGLPISLALSLLIAVVVALATGAARPSSLALLPIATLYAGGAVVAGQVTGKAMLVGADLRAPDGSPAGVGDVGLDTLNAGLPDALSMYRAPLADSWAAWLSIAVAALAALALITLRVLRVRRARRAEAEADAQAPETREPEYRAPFEPAQQPTPKTTADLFTPRKPADD